MHILEITLPVQTIPLGKSTHPEWMELSCNRACERCIANVTIQRTLHLDFGCVELHVLRFHQAEPVQRVMLRRLLSRNLLSSER